MTHGSSSEREDLATHEGSCGRADLARALGFGDDELLSATAELLGYAPGAPVGRQRLRRGRQKHDEAPEPPKPQIDRRPPVATPFWQADTFHALAVQALEREPAPSTRPAWRHRPSQMPARQPLAPWRDLQPRLRQVLEGIRLTREVDLDVAVQRLSRGRQLDRLPKLKRRRWGGRVQIIVDRSDRLVPIWHDQELVCTELQHLVPAHEIEFAVMDEALDEPQPLHSAGLSAYAPPPPGGWVLVLGDLGCLAHDRGRSARPWLALGRRLGAAGCRAVALLPCPVERCGGSLQRVWQVVPWERPTGLAGAERKALRARAEHLLRLVSPAIRIEPGLLRAVRRTLPQNMADAGTEVDVWQSEAFASRSSVAATLKPDDARKLRKAFADPAVVPEPEQQQTLKLLQAWRADLPGEIWFEEILNLPPSARALLPHPADVGQAEAFFRHVEAVGTQGDDGPTGRGAAVAWLGRVADRATGDGLGVEAFRDAIYAVKRLGSLIHTPGGSGARGVA